MDEFKKLHTRVKQTLSELDFKKPTPAQELAIPPILEGDNTLLIAPTGTGKTEAALLPVFTQLLENKEENDDNSDNNGINVLYIAPLRALNRDMRSRLGDWQEKLDLDIQVRHGDTSQYQRRKQALDPPDMLITTPETLQAILPGKRLKEHLKSVKWVIIDEVHELAESKRGTQLSIGLERLSRLTDDFQRIGLSATLGNPAEISRFLVGAKRDVRIMDASTSEEISLQIESPMPSEEDAELEDKLNAQPTLISRLRRMRDLINEHESTLVFTNTREAAESLGSRLRFWDSEAPIKVHHGSLSRETRISAEEKFRNTDLKSLICTSSMELGIDIGAIDFVIQYMSPRQVTRLVQRIGRSGHRVGGSSQGTVLAVGPDDALESGIILKHLFAHDLEPIQVHEEALDVLSHQIVGFALDGIRDVKEAYKLVKRAFPYQNLSQEDFADVFHQLSDQGIIWLDEDSFNPRKPAWKYYYTNLSMIPDTKRYTIKDLPSGRTIGTLDEEFVVGKAEPGVTFICRGEAWRVIEVEDDQVSVEPVNDPYGAIPSWEGELIPVPYKIAQEAGETQRKIETELNTAKENLEEIKKELKKKYSLDDNSADWIIRHVQEQKSEASIPTDKKILIETYKKFAVLHSYYGTKVNKTLAQILASLLSARIGASVGVRSDPYRIAFRFSQKAEPEHLKEALENLESKHVDPLIEKVLKDSSLFRWRLLHVAKRFGAIKKDADFSQIKGRQLLRAFEGTPIWKEAEREVRQEKLSIKKLQEITEEIQSGNISITIRDRLEREGPTPMGWSIVNELASYGEIVVPKRAEKAILKALKNRLQNRQVRLFCMNCYDWSVLTRVKRLPAHPECKNCGARLLTLVPWRNKKVRGILKRASKGENLSEEEEKRFERAKKAANLILTYGKPSIIAMAARGVGPATATRILSKPNTGEESFYRSILKAERLYARTHRFWD